METLSDNAVKLCGSMDIKSKGTKGQMDFRSVGLCMC